MTLCNGNLMIQTWVMTTRSSVRPPSGQSTSGVGTFCLKLRVGRSALRFRHYCLPPLLSGRAARPGPPGRSFLIVFAVFGRQSKPLPTESQLFSRRPLVPRTLVSGRPVIVPKRRGKCVFGRPRLMPIIKWCRSLIGPTVPNFQFRLFIGYRR